ncbi:hypothetical protein FRB94_013460 [Tulasnella sp. JGI-2019a]|nr:hypothetical protein FRB93_002308 [Tulasnella sp. JGI-2019a]KAG9008298.1 hypothetical protein FRB94_013460 [Tulasnella sp. JGI-2019a]
MTDYTLSTKDLIAKLTVEEAVIEALKRIAVDQWFLTLLPFGPLLSFALAFNNDPDLQTKPIPPDAPKPREEELPICIVGGGVAGLYAALILKKLGLKLEILEASDRIGGQR